MKPSTDVEPQISSTLKPSTDEVVETQSVDKYRKSGPQVDSLPTTAKAKAVPPWKQEAPKSKKQRRQQTADRKAQSQKTQRMADEGKQLDIAVVDLFAGLRTVHVAAEGTRANFCTCPRS